MKITVGADPEFFVTKDGKFRSAHGLIPGTKEKPYPVDGGAVQVDGLALEFNINPVDNADDFVKNISTVMGQMKEMTPGYDFALVPSCRFNGAHFNAQPEEAKELGCTPDYNAYTLKENPKPDNKTTMRTASGHIHIGGFETDDPLSDEHMNRCATLVKQLDCYLGLPSLLYDTDNDRRKMYGQAGAFRPKPYGVEYRVLSNAWLTSEERQRFVFKQTVAAVNDLVAGIRPINNIGEDALQLVINRGDSYSARVYVGQYMNNGKTILAEAKKLSDAPKTIKSYDPFAQYKVEPLNLLNMGD